MIKIKYQTYKGKIIEGNSIEFLSGKMKRELKSKVNLMFQSGGKSLPLGEDFIFQYF